jgi:histidinol-phosphatase
MSTDLELALQLADAADAISIAHFRTELVVERKPDSTPVTEADRAVETELRRMLTAERPGDAILGEEQGVTSAGGGRRWIQGPIDGTRSDARGSPTGATRVALEELGAVCLGVVSAPALGRRWWAERGAGAFANGERVSVSTVARVEDAVLCLPLDTRLSEIAARAWHARGLGDFWGHMLVAEGAVDDRRRRLRMSEWDLAAVQVIVEEAGGRFSDFSGARRIDSGTAVTSNGLLHAELLAALARSSGG